MMVLPATAVECVAEIAMTTLPSAAEAMGLLPNHHARRLIFLGVRHDANLLIIRNEQRNAA
jgi:hypothetical protein